jgi:hypothetical protein
MQNSGVSSDEGRPNEGKAFVDQEIKNLVE